MRPLVVYYSKTGNTVAVAEAISSELGAELHRAENIDPSMFAGRELVGLGSGIYNTRPSRHVLDLIAKIPPGTRVFVFFTSGFINRLLVRLYLSRFSKRIAKQGLNLVGVWNGPGHDNYPLLKWANIHVGRPSQEDLVAVRAFAAGLMGVGEKARVNHSEPAHDR